ncbi:MAG: hypothetical protein ACTS4U_01255 [Candidatus Hodgkinia cicadicola]
MDFAKLKLFERITRRAGSSIEPRRVVKLAEVSLKLKQLMNGRTGEIGECGRS